MSSKKQIFISNTLWCSLERFSTVGIQLISTFVLARFLSPSDFGIIGLLSVFIAVSNTLIDSGFGQSIIRVNKLTEEDCSSILYVNTAISVLLYAVAYYCSDYIACFYGVSLISATAKIAFIVLIINSFGIIQYNIILRSLNYKKMCIISVVASVTAAMIAAVFAYLWKNVWALVFQMLLASTIKTILLWLTSSFRPKACFSIQSIKNHFAFSKNILIAGLIGNLFNNLYTLVLGKAYDVTELGYFSQAEKIKNAATHNTSSVIQSVSYPLLCKMNNFGENVKQAYRKIILMSTIVVGSIMVVLVGCACDLFEILMGCAWRKSGYFLMVLGLNGILFPLHLINQNILMVKGDSRTLLLLEVLRRIIMVVIIIGTIHYDVYVFAAGMSLYSLVLVVPNMYICGSAINYGLTEQLRDFFPLFFKLIAVALIVGTLSAYITCPPVVNVIILSTISLVLLYLLFRRNSLCMELREMIISKIR